MFAPGATGSGLSDFVIERSATALTVVVSVSVLLAALPSIEVVVTVAVLVRVPLTVGAVTVSVIAGAGPGSRLARVQVTVPEDWLQLQPVPVAETYDAPAGRGSPTGPPVAVSGR